MEKKSITAKSDKYIVSANHCHNRNHLHAIPTHEDNPAIFCPLSVPNRVLCHAQTERRILRREDGVDQEELTDNVTDVTHLDEQVDCGKLVTDPVGCNFYF